MKVIVTGSTGMVGEGVLHECLHHTAVESILVINRKPCGIRDPKLTEIILPDFFDLSGIKAQCTGYDAFFFCLGVSSVGLSETEYTRLTHSLTLYLASSMVALNPGMVFCYVSGAGTDSTEKGRMMWARVKGRTENDLQKLPFKKVFLFRPGFIEPGAGLKNTLRSYKYLFWLVPIIRWLAPNRICTLKEIGMAMIHAVLKGYDKKVLEVSDIKKLAR
ncbi:MAG TPA: epimerase [Saprospiraceae bacterium]|nr:epimerase [Saprospiraceae bacterium]HNT19651.1 epimerase [Saprospiraceae bacterium]